jgi:hypothetical protein
MADLTLAEALDQIQNWYTKTVKPFEHLRDVMARAKQTLEIDLPQAERRLAEIQRGITNAETVSAAALARATEIETDATRRVAAAQAAFGKAESDARAAQAEAAAEAGRAVTILRDQRVELERDYTRRAQELGGALATKTRELQTVTAAVESLKAKISGLESG